MAFVPHYRVSMLGRLGGTSGLEQFSMSFALSGPPTTVIGPLTPNQAVWQDIADDCGEWFGHADTAIHPDAVLTMVKIAAIDENGHYNGAPVEIAKNVAGAVVGAGRPHNQDAYVVTLHTEADLGRVTGRFYVPMPSWGVGQDGRINAASIDAAESRAQAFINAVNNQPGLDVLGLTVRVASQGRWAYPKNAPRVQKIGPANHRVTQLSVGRVVDTQRRRRNKLSEGRTKVSIDS